MKTIFFSLYPMNAFRNLLMVPGSVFDEVSKAPHVRVVLLIAPGTERILRKRHPEKLAAPNVVIAHVKKFTPFTLAQKLFHFFSAYLIFTETTRTLATWGVRVDAPPAGGKRYAAPLKWFIANTFGRSRFVKTRLAPFLYERLFRARPYRTLFDVHKPDLVFLSDVAHFPDQELLAEARRRGVRTVGMTANWDHFNKYFVPLRSNHLIVQNDLIAREAVTYQAYVPEQISVVGFPQFDLYHDIGRYTDAKRTFLDRLGVPRGEKFILFIAGSVHYTGEVDIVRRIVQWIDADRFGAGAQLFIRLYPGTTRDAFREFVHHPRVCFDVPPTLTTIEGFGYFLNQIRHADLVISIYSTTLVEAAILDVPLITIGFDGEQTLPFRRSIRRAERMSHIRHLIEDGYVRIVRSFDELDRSMVEYLRHPSTDRDKRAKLARKMCGAIDGNSSKRVAESILARS